MRKLLLLASILASSILASPVSSFAQEGAFTLQNPADRRIAVNQTFIGSSQLAPFTDANPVSGLAISGAITLHSDSSLVRVILVDDQYNEYLVYESYALLTDAQSFPIKETGEESGLLNNVIPSRISIELFDASLYLEEIISSKADVYSGQAKGNLQQVQLLSKINRINQNLQNRNIPWIAGETALSLMTYQEKKAYFGEVLPNLYGFDYYTGGIFVMPGVLDSDEKTDHFDAPKGLGDSPYVKEFSWRDLHGQDWVTPVRNQSGCGSCWAFAATGATELMVNLYYNQQLNLDLSEQQILSCSGAGSCNGGLVAKSLDYIQSSGIVEEDCFPYRASDLSCLEMCQNPAERINISGYENYLERTNDNLKKSILQGAMTVGIIPWRHAITLVGYKTLFAGDRVYVKSSNANYWITLDNNSPLIGQTAWLIKNSWGSWWGDQGYAYIVISLKDIWPYHTCILKGPVTSLNYNTSDIVCMDNDGDGYYTWGIGPKPAHCPPCPDEPDGDDSNACVGPRDEFGNLQSSTTPEPVAEDVTIFEGQSVPSLTAEGENIRWYSDYGLSNLVHTGPTFATGHTSKGIYTYYVTQTLSDCESVPRAVHLSILEGIVPPTAEDVEVCFGDQRLIRANGENIRWYSDAGLTILVFEGNDYTPTVTEPAAYTYYITQTIEGIESPPSAVSYTVIGPPGPIIAEDKVFCSDEGLFMYAYGDSISWYTGAYSDELYDERNDRSYKIVTIGKQVWMAENLDIGVRIDGTTESTDNGVIEKYYYNDDPSTGTLYGGLYQWEELMDYSTLEGSQGICPAGWHMPTNEEWNVLEMELGMNPDDVDLMGLRGTDHGLQLREGGSSGFDGLMAGKRDPEGTYSSLEYYTTFWNSSGYNRTLSVHFDQVYASRSPYDTISNGFSVRCVMNDSAYVVNGRKLDVSDYETGEYIFRVSNTFNGCESEADTVSLTIIDTPPPPTVSDYEYCLDNEMIVLEAEGENIKWYHDIESTIFKDDRDNREYDMVQIGNQVWMAENLDFGIRINGTQESTDNGIVEKYHYNDDPVMGSTYGGLYQWEELMDYSDAENTQGICPAGWEIPSNRDWMQLEIALGMNQAEATLYGTKRGTDQGARLREGGTSGFNALMGGKRTPDGNYSSMGNYTTFWNSSAYNRTLSTVYDEVFASSLRYDPLTNGFSVRCLMNDSSFTTSGNQMIPLSMEPGTYEFAVTQTVEGCESERAILNCTIREQPVPPPGTSISYCEGDSIHELNVTGENIKWYADPALGTLLHAGNTFKPAQLSIGVNAFYITQSDAYCESDPSLITVELKPAPDMPGVSDVEVCSGDSIPDLVAEGDMIQWYGDENLDDLLHAGTHLSTGKSEPGTYSYYVTQTMNACESPAVLSTLAIHPVPSSPHTTDTVICESESSPEITVNGDQITWYRDSSLSDPFHTGNTYTLESAEPGTYSYFVTSTYNGCESLPSKTSITIHAVPDAPAASDVTICEGDDLPAIVVEGENICWYENAAMDNVIYFGNQPDSLPILPGSYRYYVTQTVEGCEGMAEAFELNILPSPVISLGNDTVIRDDQELILGPYPVEYSYLWSNTTSEPFMNIDGRDLGAGDHLISVQVSYQGCVFKDTMVLTIQSTLGIHKASADDRIKVYPNPTDQLIIVEFDKEIPENAIIELFDARGALMQKYRLKEIQPDANHAFKISLETVGLYYLRICNNDQIYYFKVIRQ